MKRTIFFLTLLFSLCLNAQDIQVNDTTQADTLTLTTLSDTDDWEQEDANIPMYGNSHPLNNMEDFVAIIAIIMVFGMPVFIVALVLYFRYKNRQARYRLASEALAQGKEIPQEFYGKEKPEQSQEVLVKGIKNIFLGIGLGVFLWVLTEEGGIAVIGFLIFCIGMGQVVIAYATRPKDNHPHDIERR